MISLGSTQKYYLYNRPTDMRKSFDGLSGLVKNELKRDFFTGELFIFLNRRRDRIKILVWDRSGFALYYKRLEQGSFELPKMDRNQLEAQINWDELVCILEGVSLDFIKRRKRYQK